MAYAPKHAGHALSATPLTPHHTLELYLDYTCPFSARLFNTVHTSVLPLLPKYPNLTILIRHQVQPWHPSSTLTHEAALAVERLNSTAFLPFSKALFEHQTEYFDLAVVNVTRNETYQRLAKLAEESTQGAVKAGEVYGLLEIRDGGEGQNVGNQVTNDLKVVIKESRLRGIHVSPTVVFNGVVENSISSGWKAEQWEAWLGGNIV